MRLCTCREETKLRVEEEDWGSGVHCVCDMMHIPIIKYMIYV